MKRDYYKLLFLLLIISGFYGKAQEFIPYQLAKNYFVNNSYSDQKIHALRITSAKEFNEIFGMATTMGEGGQPTVIDFSKNFVIAVIDAVSSDTEDIFIGSLTDEQKKMNLEYSLIKKNAPSSASFRFAKILIINKKHKANLVADLVKFNREKPLTDKPEDDLTCYPTIIFTWSILEEKCIEPLSTKYSLIGRTFNTNGKGGLQFDRKYMQAEIMDSSLPKNLILNKDGEKDVWIDGNYKLEQLKKDLYILKENDKEIAIGKLRN